MGKGCPFDQLKMQKLTAIERDAYANPYVPQTLGLPNGEPFSLHIAGTRMRSKLPTFPVMKIY